MNTPNCLRTVVRSCLLLGSLSCAIQPVLRGDESVSDELQINPGAETGDLTGWTILSQLQTTPSVDGGTYDPGCNPHTGLWQFVGDTYPVGPAPTVVLRKGPTCPTYPHFRETGNRQPGQAGAFVSCHECMDGWQGVDFPGRLKSSGGG